ncbi:sulfotransferase [Thauera humireducens]|uniref:Sulfotransferase n=1 Tax=Thauera humireducens TaxID=1134435 RepID=A0A127K522_9RHOO|nr:sulfotransferase [Thauera humireducens]AMO37056.1 sulfotransferase [Thauera humireducens]
MSAIHFISGLPRSGSTLLAALLRQNPRVHAGMSGPVGGMLSVLQQEMSARNEYAVFLSDAQRERILRGVFEHYYGPEYEAAVIFDTNRVWCARMSLLRTLFPQGKVIACVRDLPWIIDSVERLIQRNALSPSSIFNYQTSGTVYSRAEGIANGEGLVGYAYNALKEAFFGDYAANLMLVQYDTLVAKPQLVLDAIYDFIGEPAFRHDFDNVRFEADEFDARTGTPGLHAVRQRVVATPRTSVLPPDIFQRFQNDAFWRNPALNTRKVRIV